VLGDPTNILKSFDLVIKGEVGFPRQNLQIIEPVYQVTGIHFKSLYCSHDLKRQ
jgi:hypothetical protein